MMLFTELLQVVSSDAVNNYDYRNIKETLFVESAKALSDFRPFDFGETKAYPIQIIDFFSGAGGTSLGFAAINRVIPLFRFLGGCDINFISASTYSKNFGTPIICDNILEIAETPETIRAYMNKIGYNLSMPTILIGCPPCQGFSSHGKKRWNQEDDDRNSLAIAFSRIVAEVQPTMFLMENVPEFLSQKYWHYFSKSREAFIKAGYTVKQKVSNSADYGVPQERFRSVIIGMKKDFLLPEGFLSPKEYRTVRDVISSLKPLSAGESDPIDSLHKAVAHKQSTIDIIKQVPHDGGNLPAGVGPKCLTRVSGFSDVYGRLSWDKPAITITHYARNPASGRYTHPVQNRGLTAREAARLQSFPDGFKFEGKSDDIYRQIGEAVPPLLACGVAVSALIELISCEPTDVQLDNGYACVTAPLSNSFSSVIAGIKNVRRRA